MTKRYCDKCIAKKVTAKLIPPHHTWNMDHNIFTEDFKHMKPCDLCGTINKTVTAYPPMDQFTAAELDLPEFKGTEEKVTIDDKNAKSKTV